MREDDCIAMAKVVVNVDNGYKRQVRGCVCVSECVSGSVKHQAQARGHLHGCLPRPVLEIQLALLSVWLVHIAKDPVSF